MRKNVSFILLFACLTTTFVLLAVGELTLKVYNPFDVAVVIFGFSVPFNLVTCIWYSRLILVCLGFHVEGRRRPRYNYGLGRLLLRIERVVRSKRRPFLFAIG